MYIRQFIFFGVVDYNYVVVNFIFVYFFQAKAVVAAVLAATDKTFKALSSQASVGEDPVLIQSPAMSLAAVKKSPSEVAGAALDVSGGKFGMPKTSTSDDNSTDESPVDMKVIKGGCFHSGCSVQPELQ